MLAIAVEDDLIYIKSGHTAWVHAKKKGKRKGKRKGKVKGKGKGKLTILLVVFEQEDGVELINTSTNRWRFFHKLGVAHFQAFREGIGGRGR